MKDPPAWQPEKESKDPVAIDIARVAVREVFKKDHAFHKIAIRFKLQHPELELDGAFMTWIQNVPDSEIVSCK